MRYETLTGLSYGQLHELTARVAGRLGEIVRPGGRPAATGLSGSVAMVVTLMRKNITQEAAGAIFGCSQPTVSRRWDLIRPVIGQVLAGLVPDPAKILGSKGTALADGTIAPTWDWKAIPDLYSGKAGYPGINVQVAATLGGQVAAVGPVPVHGARHDAHAFAASALKDLISRHGAVGDLGYTGVDGITTTGCKTPPGGGLHPSQATFNKDISSIRAANECAVAHLKTWRMLSEEGGRYRAPISKYAEMLSAVIGLFFFSNYYEAFE